MMAADLTAIDLFFIVLSGVIGGGLILSYTIFAVVRYSRDEATGAGRFTDITFFLMAIGFCLYGMWRAGFFG